MRLATARIKGAAVISKVDDYWFFVLLITAAGLFGGYY